MERNRDLLLYLLDIDCFKDFNDRAAGGRRRRPVPEDGLLETMEGSFVKLMRTVRRGSREIPRPSCAVV
jgi:hypothetical protein